MNGFDADQEFSRYDVTCRTEGCENAGHTIRVLADADVPQVVCGPCGSQITEVVLFKVGTNAVRPSTV